MAEVKVGDKVRLTQDVSYSNHKKGDIGVVTRTSGGLTSMIRVRMEYNNTNGDTTPFEPYEIELVEELEPVADAISPSVYQFPNGVEVRDISAHLTSFGGQAVQYVCRSTRLDGVVKGLPVQDLKKAIQLLEWEIERLEA